MKEKLKRIYFRIIGPIKAKRFKFTDFTIISNNCFGGIIYRNHHLPYLTPTAGLFIMPKDFIKFINNIKYYLSIEPVEIKIDQSKYKDYLNQIKYSGTIGRIDDVEIMFLHYPDFLEAKEKWIKRSKRVNYDKIIYKFNDQNGCTYEDLKAFNDFDANNKICFTAQEYEEMETIQFKIYKKYEYVLDDTKVYKKYINIYDFINNITK